MTSSAAKRRRSAYVAAAAAKQRRRKILAIGGAVVFVALLAYEIPHTLKLLKHTTPTAAIVTTTTAPQTPKVIPKTLRTVKASDPFAARALVSVDPGVRPSPGGRDPFVSAGTLGAVTPAPPAAQPLPQTIVIGTPTAHGAVDRGWIVILASIPMREGRSSALTFARSARQGGITSVAVLNSSNRRPLRGGYWVVYTGPVGTLGAVQRLASSVHASGYLTAYIRELIVYR